MLKILDHPWHQVHAYRLHSLPAVFTFASIPHGGQYWNLAQRPMPDNFQGVQDVHDINPKDYDLALLHLDQLCDRNKWRAMAYRIMKSKTKGIPQIVIIHATPDNESNRRRVLQLLGDLPAICNSRQAAEEWDGGEERVSKYGIPQFTPIIHGYRVDDFFNYSLERRRVEAFTVCSGGALSREYHGLPLVKRLMRDVPLLWYGHNGNRGWLPSYSDYRNMLASSLIYFSPTRRGPMPGARTEAALSGCCIVSVPGNDWESYIDHGKNGYIVRTYEEARTLLRSLLLEPEQAYEVGQAGRAMAREHFNSDRFTTDWLEYIEHIVGGFKRNEQFACKSRF